MILVDYDEDPSKKINHDQLFKKRQMQSMIIVLNNLFIDQSYVFGDKLNEYSKIMDRKNIKKRVEGLSVENPFLDDSLDKANRVL